MEEDTLQNIFWLPTTPLCHQRPTATTIIIDNGSTTIRWGFGMSLTPYASPNAVAKYKEWKTNKPLLLFGEAIKPMNTIHQRTTKPHQKLTILCSWPSDCVVLCTLKHICWAISLGVPVTSKLMGQLYTMCPQSHCINGIMSFYQNHLPPPKQPFSSNGLVISTLHQLPSSPSSVEKDFVSGITLIGS